MAISWRSGSTTVILGITTLGVFLNYTQSDIWIVWQLINRGNTCMESVLFFLCMTHTTGYNGLVLCHQECQDRSHERDDS